MARPVMTSGNNDKGEAMEWRTEWTVRARAGRVHPGPFTEKQARAWMAHDAQRDERRRPEARGRQRLLRRQVTEWEEVRDGD